MKVETALIHLLEFIVISFFTFVVFVWFGGLLLLLLSLWITLSEFLGEHLLGMALGIPLSFLLVVFLCMYIGDKTRFFQVLEDVGRNLICMAFKSVHAISGTRNKSGKA